MQRIAKFLKKKCFVRSSDSGHRLIDDDGELDANFNGLHGIITFDVTLPTAHSYLSDDWQEVSGRTFHEDGMILHIPILTLPGVVLMPGQMLPLHLFSNSDIAMIKHCLDRDKTFSANNNRTQKLACVGTTAEILAVKEEDSMVMKVKTIGRQRFEVLDTRLDIGGIIIARVKILPDIELPDLLQPICPSSLLKHTQQYSDHCKYDFSTNTNQAVINSIPKANKFHASILTQWPSWVYDQYNCEKLMMQIRDELQNWNESFDLDKVPTDPANFSYWVASTLPLDDYMRLELLRIDCPQQRLRCELTIMKKCTVMCCKGCGQSVAELTNVFSMSLEGPLGTYVNPGGHVHETLTVYHANNLSTVGRPSTESSWFPG
ncbi:hypothetical protein HELRODRAFT_105243 [Helobdella robusta]|uniref:Protein cereblon n=1 Tax=Helobdella robusta TaxID=6412 RepID=T1EDS0_HELRO|nr:hypothetical protein HELRODRAFT_105243 [Helobdella robusta]ESO12236.1 hypothetical protein HELRODRAFT_105243 [Helobdella robusta]